MNPEDLPSGPLVQTTWLAEHIGTPGLRVIDTTWTWAASEARPDENFVRERIPGALYFDHASFANPTSLLTDTRPSAEHFSQRMGVLGVAASDVVVVYSQKGTAGGASRAWWLLRSFGHAKVYVLDGGLVQWKEAGLSLEAGDKEKTTPCPYEVEEQGQLVADAETLRTRLQDSSLQILDARSEKFFMGQGIFPSGNTKVASVVAGRIPNSLNLPSSVVVDPSTKRMKADAELRSILVEGGIDLHREIVTTCSLGIGACTIALALATVGCDSAAVFDGAWQEWGSDPSLPK